MVYSCLAFDFKETGFFKLRAGRPRPYGFVKCESLFLKHALSMFKNKSFASDAPETELGLRSAGGETPPLRFQKCKITIKTCLTLFAITGSMAGARSAREKLSFCQNVALLVKFGGEN